MMQFTSLLLLGLLLSSCASYQGKVSSASFGSKESYPAIAEGSGARFR